MILTTDGAGNVLSQSHYETYGEHTDYGAMPSDKHRANTKVEDADTNLLLLEGHRYRLIDAGIFLSPDPLEYMDGLHRYAYCGFNPMGKVGSDFADPENGIFGRQTDAKKPSLLLRSMFFLMAAPSGLDCCYRVPVCVGRRFSRRGLARIPAPCWPRCTPLGLPSGALLCLWPPRIFP